VVGDEEFDKSTSFSHLAATPDGGVVVAGTTAAGPGLGKVGHSYGDLLVMKFSSSGTVVWQRVYGSEGLYIYRGDMEPRVYVNDNGTLSIMTTYEQDTCNDCGCGPRKIYHIKLDGGNRHDHGWCGTGIHNEWF
jgi:hypothetical protein